MKVRMSLQHLRRTPTGHWSATACCNRAARLPVCVHLLIHFPEADAGWEVSNALAKPERCKQALYVCALLHACGHDDSGKSVSDVGVVHSAAAVRQEAGRWRTRRWAWAPSARPGGCGRRRPRRARRPAAAARPRAAGRCRCWSPCQRPGARSLRAGGPAVSVCGAAEAAALCSV